MNDSPQTIIIFFDGVCHLCNGTVDWLISQESHNENSPRKLSFASLQGQTAKALLPEDDQKSIESVIVLTKDKRLLRRSDAVFYCLEQLSSWPRLLAVFKYLPRFVRDGVYLFVAQNRYRIWGQRDTCRIPTPAESKFLLP